MFNKDNIKKWHEKVFIQNKYNCPIKIWKKFNHNEKIKYNKIIWLLSWSELYPNKIKDDSESINIIAHNSACQIIWNMELAND